MKIFNWLNVRLLLMLTLVVFLFSFTSNRNEKRKIKKIDVIILDKNMPFLKPEMVNKLLIEKKHNVKTITKETLVLKKLEKSICENKLIQKADVFVSVDGVLTAVIKQKSPLGRVVGDYESFYIDNEGNRMPLSDNFSARVPLVSGKLSSLNKEKLSETLKLINEDEFLKKNIISVHVLSNGSLVMQNRNYNFKIDFGRTINVEKKFMNYKAFFQKAVLDSSINKYKKINLKFTQQVVCIK